MSGEQRLVAGRYRLLSALGAGGMGTVWRAEDVVLGREVAVKEVTFPHGLSEEDCDVLRERTRREARAAARLDHPSAVTVYDVVEDGGSPYLVMELVEARTLSQVVRADGPLTPQRTAQVGLALLGALETAHAQGILHRDVKPGNVLVTGAGRVVLTDFGIASSPGDASITSTGLLLGSPAYIAPERARGLAPGPASDLWSLGATLFTAVEGRPPYDGGEPMATVTAVVTGQHEPFIAAGPLAPVLEGLLERDPEQRTTVEQARALLRPVADSVGASGTADSVGASGTADSVGAARRADSVGASGTAPEPGPPTAGARRHEATTVLPVGELQAAEPDPPPRTADDPRRPAADPRYPAAAPPRPSAGPARPLLRVDAPARRRSRLSLAALGLLAVVGAVAVGATLTDRPPAGATPGPESGASPISPEPGSAAPAVPAAPPAQAALPEGWSRYVEPEEGWSIGVPPGFDRSTYRGTQVQLRDAETRRTLRVDWSDDPSPSALAAWQAYSPQLARVLRDYEQVRLEPVEFQGLDAADLEFTYRADQAELHVLDRTVVAEGGGRAVALYWQVRDRDYAASLEQFEQMAATFRFE